MWCLCRKPAWMGKYMYDPVWSRVSLCALVWCCPARGTETGSIELRLGGSDICKDELPVIGGFLCVCGTPPPYLPPSHYLAITAFSYIPLLSLSLTHCCLDIPAVYVTHIYFHVKGSVHMNYKKTYVLIYPVVVFSYASASTYNGGGLKFSLWRSQWHWTLTFKKENRNIYIYFF